MEITIDLSELRIVVHLGRWHKYALIINKSVGHTIKCSVPELIDALERIAAG